jgi:hypothetical protein
MAKVQQLDLHVKPLKVIGIHKQSHQPVLIMDCTLEETAMNKKNEVEQENMNFFKDFEKYQLSLQPLSYREAKIDSVPEYNKYLQEHQQKIQKEMPEYIKEHAPEFIDFNIFIV